MKKYLIGVLLLFTLALVEAAANKLEITGAFGLKLGDTFDIKSASKRTKASDGTLLYYFKPQKRTRGLVRYQVEITPITHKIYNISAYQQFDDITACEREQIVFKHHLTRKYGEFVDNTLGSEGVEYLRVENRSIMLICEDDDSNATLIIVYSDLDLQDLSEKEYAQMKIKKSGMGYL